MTAGRTYRTALLLALAAAPAGCFNSHNPGYFPYYLPGGAIVQEHAKPRFGYFRDFDPKACKLDVTPQNATAPLASQIVLVATVSDKDGQPRRSRRVEWVLEGPGNIIEVDEAGLYAGRGYKVDNKYAVTYTNYVTHTVTRGNDDPKDDVEICPGQTFCVVSSAVAGETTVTAYAPGVFNWDRGRVLTKVVWGDGRFTFPPAAVVRYDKDYTLTTAVARFEQDGPAQPHYRVRYRVLDADAGAPAVLVSRGGAGTAASQSGTTAKEVEADVDADGRAAVRLVQPSPRPGKTRVAVEILKAGENGTAGAVVARHDTLVEWAAAALSLDVVAPPVAGVSGPVPVTVSLTNTGQVDARESQVRVTLSDGATLDRSEPPPVRQETGALVFDLPAVPAGKKQEVVLQVHPARAGPVTVSADVTTADRFQAHKDTTLRVEPGRLGVAVEAPPAALAGQPLPVRVAVTNPGAAPAANVVIWARFDDALKHASGKNPVELPVGTIAPGHTTTVDLPLSGTAAGRYAVRVTATADGGVTAAADPVTLELRRAELKVTVAGPQLAYLNQDFAWTVGVTNAGDGPVSNVVVRATLPTAVRLKDAGGAKVGSGSVEWAVGPLKAGEQKTLPLTVTAAQLAARAAVTAVAQADAIPTGGDATRPVGDPIEGRGEGVTAVIGTPALVLELATPPGVVEIGKPTSFQVRLRNKGTVSVQNIDLTATAPAELKVVRATGKSPGQVGATGTVTYPRLGELKPGEVATFTIDVNPVQAGDARFRAEVKAAHLTSPLTEEQAVQVIGGR